MQLIDIESLGPVERMELADVLYDSAIAEIEAVSSTLTPDELAEIDRRIVGRASLTHEQVFTPATSAKEAY
jgi:hypothetical protein